MNPFLKVIMFLLGCALALYLNVWWIILPLSILYGYFSSKSSTKTGLVAFVIAFITWTALLYVKDSYFFRSPSELLSGVFGGLPPVVIPLIGGLIGGLVSLFGAIGGRLIKID